jgi:hypothetical protein
MISSSFTGSNAGSAITFKTICEPTCTNHSRHGSSGTNFLEKSTSGFVLEPSLSEQNNLPSQITLGMSMRHAVRASTGLDDPFPRGSTRH